MSGFDITVAVTAHNESVVAGPTMRSAEAAIAEAEAAGYTIERLVGLDRPTPECAQFFGQPDLSAWSLSEHDFGDPFRVRNAIAERASGKYIAFLDADDLYSENWLAMAARRLDEAERADERVIVHPELNWIFESSEVVFVKPDQDSYLFNPYYLYFANYYDMLSMAPRQALIEKPYGPRDIQNGFGYQDWQWNVETMGLGWKHVVVKDTVIFKRRRAMSVSVENVQRKAVIRAMEPLAIDRVNLLKPTASSLTT
ncbi:MAG: glycosyltransferase family 2 protein [Rhizobiaceae bacterium]|nr:glycosyltransferase family 2 protein [Rhizobiaceae bacterium]MCV0405592.1 glycosyltransferase family 2 protein [Rhizobiaceae bacterium]